MPERQPDELSRLRAYAESADAAASLFGHADRAEARDAARLTIRRSWVSSARCHLMHTHLRVDGAPTDAVETMAGLLFRSAELGTLPWYPEALAGEVLHRLDRDPPAIAGRGVFDLGLRAPRSYVQLAVLHAASPNRRAVTLRSIADPSPDPDRAVRAFMLDPSGDVVSHDGSAFHWHHLVTTPGPEMLPRPLDRWLVAALRAARLSRQEEATYRREADGVEALVRGDLTHD